MLPTNFHDAASLRELSLEAWQAILTVAGDTARLSATVSYEKLWESLTTEQPTDELLDALEVIHELGTDAGRELLAGAAADQQVDLGAVDDEPAQELAARVWRESRTSSPFAAVLTRARFSAYQVSRPREYREYAGARAKPGRPLDKDRVREAVATWCRENGKAEPVEVYAYESGGEWRCEILRGEALKSVLEIKEHRPKLLNFRPGVADHLRYDPETGRLGIATRSPRLQSVYRELVGSVVADNASFFSSDNICTLRPLQEKGSALFERHRPPGILRVDVTELRWRRGDREKIWVKGPDCFRLLDDLGARLHEGELIEARLVVWFAGTGRRGIVNIKVPGRIEINAGAKEPLVERLLDEAGIRGVFDEDNAQQDLWSLYPWRHDERAWRRHVGADFDRLLTEKVLRAVSLESATHPDHPGSIGALEVALIDAAGTTVGFSDDPAIPVRTLTSSDVTGYELDVPAVARQLATVLGLDGVASEIANGLWLIGKRTFSASLSIAVFFASRKPGETVKASVQAATNGARPVLLVPLGRAAPGDVPDVECRLPSGPHDGLLAQIVERLGLQGHVPPTDYLTEELVLDVANGVAWYHQVQLSRLKGDSQPFKFAVEVARAGGHVVPKAVLNERLSSARLDDGIAKQAKSDFLSAVRASFKDAEQECPSAVASIFVSQSGGYALKGTARILERAVASPVA